MVDTISDNGLLMVYNFIAYLIMVYNCIRILYQIMVYNCISIYQSNNGITPSDNGIQWYTYLAIHITFETLK